MSEPALEQVDLLVTNIDWMITVDGDRRVIRNGAVAVRDGRFIAVATTEELTDRFKADRTFNASGSVATPGFVDGHLHSSFQLSRGLADEVNAKAFLFERMYPYEGAMEERDVYDSARLAAWELVRHGVTCFIDPGNYFPQATVRACQEIGIRVNVARSTFDKGSSVLGLLPERMIDTTDSAFAATREILEEYAGPIERGYSASASFRGLNNSSDELITKLRGLAEDHDTFLQCHACFSPSTRDASVSQHGTGEITRLQRLGVLDDKMLIVHAGWLEPNEVIAIGNHHPTIVASGTSSVHNGYGILAVGFVPELLEMGTTVALGSDHASSGAVDMCREMYLLSCGYKEARHNARVMAPETVVEMATLHGARALGAGEHLGSVEPGKLADLVLFDARTPEWLPMYNPVSNLVYSATGTTIHAVMIGGKIVIDQGHLTTVDEDDLRVAADDAARRIINRLDPDEFISLKWPISASAQPDDRSLVAAKRKERQ